MKITEKHSGLRGHVAITRVNKSTGEKTLWYEDDNVIDISGYQFILMKMFGLYLDSPHGVSYEELSKDTNLVIPDLNNGDAPGMGIGVNPNEYSEMTEDISSSYFIQGFMIGNGGSGEDGITTKNTDYSFIKLRNPVPFQQSNSRLPSDIISKYLGKLRTEGSSFTKSYYIKKFDERPHIYHGWWTKGQSWDTMNPIATDDLGPKENQTPRSDRIETYCECKMSLDETDCLAYFEHEGSTSDAVLNELGLVAYDAVKGTRSLIDDVYNSMIRKFISVIFNNDRSEEDVAFSIQLASDIYDFLNDTINITSYGQSNINAFVSLLAQYKEYTPESTIEWSTLQTTLADATNNIGVEAFYNHSGTLVYFTDQFLTFIQGSEFTALTTDEAQRIKMVTYYTFNAIPLSANYKIEISYRIYAN